MKKYNILLLENNEIISSIIFKTLDAEKYQINQINEISSISNLILVNRFDMVIIGEKFQEISKQLILTIKSNTKIVPVLFILDKHDDSGIISALEVGADGYIGYPINPKLLNVKIKSFVDKYELLHKRFETKLQNIRGNISIVLPHEFRTSISGIKGLTKTISQITYQKSFLTKGEIQEIFEMSNLVLNSSSYLSRITENILLYSKLQLQKHNLEKDMESQNGIISNPKEIIEDIAYSLTANTNREADLFLKIQNANIQISQYHFQKIIYELIDNSLKFSDICTQISLISRVYLNKYIIEIEDKGRGMSSEQLLEIDAFKQFDRNQYEQQGNGLGLIIAKELTEINNGTFSIISKKDIGTKIIIEFPIINNN